MSNVIKISDYSPICMTSPYTAKTVLNDISNMNPSDNEVVIDFDGINFPPYDIGEGHSIPENYSFNKSFSYFTFTDGTPFGIKEE